MGNNPGLQRLKVLHVAAEVYPLVKTGGLADVVAALPPAQAAAGADVTCCCRACRPSWTRCNRPAR